MNRFRFSRSGANNAHQSTNASPFDDLRPPVEPARPAAARSPASSPVHDDLRDERDLIEAVQSQLINETDTSAGASRNTMPAASPIW